MPSNTCFSEGNNHLPLTVVYALSTTAFYIVGLYCYMGALLTCVQLVNHWHSQVFLCEAAAYSVSLPPTQMCGVIPSEVQDVLFICVELYEVSFGLLQVKIPLSSSPPTVMTTLSIWCHLWTCWDAEGAFCPIIQIADENISDLLLNPWHPCQLPTRHKIIVFAIILSMMVQPVFYPTYHPLLWLIPPHFCYKDPTR